MGTENTHVTTGRLCCCVFLLLLLAAIRPASASALDFAVNTTNDGADNNINGQ
jgi:hypothetical protein